MTVKDMVNDCFTANRGNVNNVVNVNTTGNRNNNNARNSNGVVP